MTTLDRMFFAGYLRSYFIVLSSLLSLYVVVDLFMNLNDFSNNHFWAMVQHIAGYYSVQISLIFDRLCEAIALLAAMFTVAWMQRNNELLPQLSAGISTRRILRPILLGGFLALLLGPLNQEFIIPEVADQLTIPRDDPELRKPFKVRGAFDPYTSEHIVGTKAYRAENKIEDFQYSSNPEAGSGLIHLRAEYALYIPPQTNVEYSGGWKLMNTEPAELHDKRLENLTWIRPGEYFLKTEMLDFNAITRRSNFLNFESTWDLWSMLQKPGPSKQSQTAVTFHIRLTRILVGAILIILGLSVILHDQNQHVFISAGLCLAISATFYVAIFLCKYLGESEYLPAALAAWLPVLTFGPFAIMLFDGVHT